MTDDGTTEQGPGGEQTDHERVPLADNPLTAGRLAQHVDRLAGDGYPYRFERSATAAHLHERYAELEPGTETEDVVVVAGRVMLLRSFGKLTFVTLADVSGRIQLFIDRRSIGEEGHARFSEVDLGDWVGATGVVMTTKKGELSVRVSEFELLQKSLRPLPDKWHGLQDIELRSRRRYIDLIVNEDARRVALTRAGIVSELRRQFEARGYVEVETLSLIHI